MQPQTLKDIARFYDDGVNQTISRGSGERTRDILKFIQEKQAENNRFLKDTTSVNILTPYCAWTKYPVGITGALSSFNRMVRKGIIVRYSGNRHRGNYRINYLNPSIPEEMLENATEEDKEFVRKIKNRMEELSNNGKNVRMEEDVIVYKDTNPEEKSEPEPTPEPIPEPIQEPVQEPTPEVAPVVVPEPVVAPRVEAPRVETPQTVTMPVEVSKTDSGINLTITLNLNLNK